MHDVNVIIMDFYKELYTFFQNPSNISESSFSHFLSKLPSSYIPNLQQLAFSFPFPDLHPVLLSFLRSQNSSPSNPPLISNFIPSSSIKSLLNETRFPADHEKTLYTSLMQAIFTTKVRIDPHERLMGSFPIYLQQHQAVMCALFSPDLPLSVLWRYQIAYLSASAHQCEYLMAAEEFIYEVLHGMRLPSSELSEKLRLLASANNKLAHRPWEFSEADVRQLLGQWNLNELIVALTVICQFHCLAGFSYGLGVHPSAHSPTSMSPPSSPIKLHPKDSLYEALMEYSEHAAPEGAEDLSEEEMEDENSSIAYVNYSVVNVMRSFNASDFTFDQAYYVLEKAAPELAEAIWHRIKTAYAMTYESIGSETGVNTGPLRRAFWNYVQRLYGLQYDDYNYTDINRFLRINTKKYIKKTACFPETVSKADFDAVDIDLTFDELIHVNIIICEARFEAQLVYMLHAVQKAHCS
jgi:sestrin 1/3